VNALLAFARAIDRLNEAIGRAVSWLVLGLVLVQLVILLLHHVYGQGSLSLRAWLLSMQGMLFLGGIAYALMHSGHVRADIVHRLANARLKAAIDLLGSLFLLLPAVALLVPFSVSYLHRAWRSIESSAEVSSTRADLLLKSALVAFALTLFLQGLSVAIHGLAALIGHGHPVNNERKAER
jgi:TRAP-type mannitol/chloroaromatic compound transport system permease small subunit